MEVMTDEGTPAQLILHTVEIRCIPEYIYRYIYMYIYIWFHIHMTEDQIGGTRKLYIYIYIYMHICGERERGRDREGDIVLIIHPPLFT
jgi:hypothetical protein